MVVNGNVMNINKANQQLESTRLTLKEYPFYFQKRVKSVMRMGVSIEIAIYYSILEEWEILYAVEGKGLTRKEFFEMWQLDGEASYIWQLIGYAMCDEVFTWQEIKSTLCK